MIRRCAWHEKYFGHVKIIAIIKDGEPITTDGMCPACRQRWLKDIEDMKKEKKEETNEHFQN